jgi:hypothetical protein
MRSPRLSIRSASAQTCAVQNNMPRLIQSALRFMIGLPGQISELGVSNAAGVGCVDADHIVLGSYVKVDG